MLKRVFRSVGTFEARGIPKFDDYKKKNDTSQDRNFTYLVVGSSSVLGAVFAKNLVHDFVGNLSAANDVLARAKIEVDLNKIPEGKNLTIKWRGKPVFIRHRTPQEIEEAASVPVSELPHKELDSERTKQPEWLVMIGVCTHLGCVPIGESGDYNGWFCPCHGSHYDISGRIRRGPAPLNLEVPNYEFVGDKKILIG